MVFEEHVKPGAVAIWLGPKRNVVRAVDLWWLHTAGSCCLLGALAGGAVEELTLLFSGGLQDFPTGTLCLPRLRKLTFLNQTEEALDLMGGFAHLPLLASLRLRRCNVGRGDSLGLAGLSQLRELEFWMTPQDDLGAVVSELEEDLASLNTLTHLTSISLSLFDDLWTLEPIDLSALKHLRALDLTKCGAGVANRNYKSLTRLSALSLADCGLWRLSKAMLRLPELKVGTGYHQF